MSDEQGPVRALVEQAIRLQGAVEIRWIPEIRIARETQMNDIRAAADALDAESATLVDRLRACSEAWNLVAHTNGALEAELAAARAQWPHGDVAAEQLAAAIRWARLHSGHTVTEGLAAAVLARLKDAQGVGL